MYNGNHSEGGQHVPAKARPAKKAKNQPKPVPKSDQSDTKEPKRPH
jgi:hypothetical protein